MHNLLFTVPKKVETRTCIHISYVCTQVIFIHLCVHSDFYSFVILKCRNLLSWHKALRREFYGEDPESTRFVNFHLKIPLPPLCFLPPPCITHTQPYIGPFRKSTPFPGSLIFLPPSSLTRGGGGGECTGTPGPPLAMPLYKPNAYLQN